MDPGPSRLRLAQLLYTASCLVPGVLQWARTEAPTGHVYLAVYYASIHISQQVHPRPSVVRGNDPRRVCVTAAQDLSVSLDFGPNHMINTSLHSHSIEMPLHNFMRPYTGLASANPEGGLVSFDSSPDAPVELQSSAIVVDERDHEGVLVAARNLAQDFARVTRGSPRPIVRSNGARIEVPGSVAIVIGCVESSPLVQRLERDGTADFSGIRGKWESFQTSLVRQPFDGCTWALVIAGSDKRGTIYGAYTLSEQIGVSP